MTAQHEQPTRPEAVKRPAWVREPQAPKGDVKHAPPPREDNQSHEEPGYGHGV
jgi:hypothetical protein